MGLVTPVPWFRIENFLTREQTDTAFSYCRSQLPGMVAGQVTPPGTSGGEDHRQRKARVCFNVHPIWGLFETKLLTLQPYIAAQLGIQPWVPSNLEKQITVHSAGEYFHVHNDTGTDADLSWTRVVTWVYYLNEGNYTGGELKIGDRYFPPHHNTVLFFPSDIMHEVQEVQGLGSRWTVNGWYHRVAG